MHCDGAFESLLYNCEPAVEGNSSDVLTTMIHFAIHGYVAELDWKGDMSSDEPISVITMPTYIALK